MVASHEKTEKQEANWVEWSDWVTMSEERVHLQRELRHHLGLVLIQTTARDSVTASQCFHGRDDDSVTRFWLLHADLSGHSA